MSGRTRTREGAAPGAAVLARPGRPPRRPADEDEVSQRVELSRNDHLVCRVSLIDERFQPLLESFQGLAHELAEAGGSVEPGSAEEAGGLQAVGQQPHAAGCIREAAIDVTWAKSKATTFALGPHFAGSHRPASPRG